MIREGVATKCLHVFNLHVQVKLTQTPLQLTTEITLKLSSGYTVLNR